MSGMDRTISVDLTGRELHVLTCAMAGNFPSSLSDVRMPTLRKLAKAHRTLVESDRNAEMWAEFPDAPPPEAP